MKRGRPPKIKLELPPQSPSVPEAEESVNVPHEVPYPTDWHPGRLLNVRNAGDCYLVTLYPEEYDPRYPDRALRFRNPAECQNFVSHWYARQSPDPRAR